MTIEYMWWSSMLLCPRKSTLPHNLRSYHSDVPKIGNSLWPSNTGSTPSSHDLTALLAFPTCHTTSGLNLHFRELYIQVRPQFGRQENLKTGEAMAGAKT